MSTKAEREATLKSCIEKMAIHFSYAHDARSKLDMQLMERAIASMVTQLQPLFNVYTADLADLISPICKYNAPVLIVLFRQLADLIEKQYPEAHSMTEYVSKIYSCNLKIHNTGGEEIETAKRS